jgi:hypothetical protein
VRKNGLLFRIGDFARQLSEEPPFRLFTRALIKRLPVSIRTKARWDATGRPHYLAGVLAAAEEAVEEGVAEISIFEFGVAAGNGLLALSEIAAAVEAATKVKIAVYGFDTGSGLPDPTRDYRDHPDQWREGDFPMNEALLRKSLKPNTRLIIGDVRDTVPLHLPQITQPIGFVAIDVDTYSSACDVLWMFANPCRKMLLRAFVYCDDLDLTFTHRFAGELLAIEEFNESDYGVKIDSWRGLRNLRPFPEAAWLNRMFIAHDIEAISKARKNRHTTVLPLEGAAGAAG